jgi:hypothetical protein
MRRLFKWIGGTAGGIAAYRFVRRQEAALQPSPQKPDTRAEELRTKLAETRAAEPVKPEEPTAEAEVVPEPEAEPESPDDRRRRVHEEGRAALDEMRSE